jgi:hypothetical protein
MRKFISSIPAKTVTDAIVTAVNGALTPSFTAFKINLADDEKTGLRTFAEGREGYVRNVLRVATQFPNALSRSDVPIDLANMLDYYGNLEGVRLALTQALEVIQETSLGVAADGMAFADRYVQSLQISRKNDSALDEAMREIDDFNSRFGRNTTPPTP